MSGENVDVVLRWIEAFNRRDSITASALWRSDAVADWSRARGPFKGVYRGGRERVAFQEEFWSTFQYVHIETYDVAETGSEVVVGNTAHMRGRDDAEVNMRVASIYEIRDGFVATVRDYGSRDKALEAAGLRE
jgi:ketosteroid isomerase-like protein